MDGWNFYLIYFTLFFSLYFEIFLMLTLWENWNEIKTKKNKKEKKDFLPSVSIIVPCWNEEDTVAGTIKSLLDLDYPKDKLKIIVVNDGSTDNTSNEVKKFLPHKQIILLEKENGGKHTAMNLALKNINTDLVGSLDADSFVKKDALLKIVKHFKNKNVTSVTSSTKTLDDANFWAMLQKAEFLTSVLLRKIFSLLGSVFITPGPFSIFRTSFVKEIGGWKKAHNTEDLEIGIRIQISGHIIENEESSVVYTKPLKTFKSLYKQRLRWVYGFLRNAWDYKWLFFNRKYGNLGMLILPSFIIGLVLSILLYFTLLYNILIEFYDWLKKIWILGIDFSWPSWDWFYFNTDTAILVSIILLLFSIYIILLAKKITDEKVKFSLEIPFYILAYGFIAPIWLTVALFKAIFNIKQEWEDN